MTAIFFIGVVTIGAPLCYWYYKYGEYTTAEKDKRNWLGENYKGCRLKISLIKRLYRVNSDRWNYNYPYSYTINNKKSLLTYTTDKKEIVTVELSPISFLWIQYWAKNVKKFSKYEIASKTEQNSLVMILESSQRDINKMLEQSEKDINSAHSEMKRIDKELKKKK